MLFEFHRWFIYFATWLAVPIWLTTVKHSSKYTKIIISSKIRAAEKLQIYLVILVLWAKLFSSNSYVILTSIPETGMVFGDSTSKKNVKFKQDYWMEANLIWCPNKQSFGYAKNQQGSETVQR